MYVLFVEEDPTLGGAVRDHLAAHGHAVDWTRDLAGADRAWDATRYDVILLDVPGRGSLDFIKARRLRGDETPVIVVTSTDQLAMRIEALHAGADDYLTMPFDLAELTARLRALVS